MKNRIILFLLLAFTAFACSDDKFGNEYDPILDSDFYVLFPGNVNDYSDTIPINTTLQLKAHIRATGGLEKVEYEFIYKNGTVEKQIAEIKKGEENFMTLNVKKTVSESSRDIQGWKVIATDKKGDKKENTYHIKSVVLANDFFFQYRNVELSSSINLQSFEVTGNAYFGTTSNPAVANLTEAIANPGKIQFVYIWDFIGNANRLITPSIRTHQADYIPDVMSRYIPDNLTPRQEIYMTTVPVDDATFEVFFKGDPQTVTAGITKLLMGGAIPNARLRSVPQAGQTFLFRVNGPVSMGMADLMNPDPAIRWGLIKVRQIAGDYGPDSRIIFDLLLQR